MVRYFLGFDGGASKSEAVVLSHDGRVLARHRSGPVTLHEPVSQNTIVTIKDLVAKVVSDAGIQEQDLASAGFGVSGVDFDEDLPEHTRLLARASEIYIGKIHAVNDGVAALWGGTTSERAAVLQIGSAFTAAYRNGIGTETPFDHHNLGQWVDLRLDIMTAFFRAAEGREPRTPLVDLVFDHFGTRDVDQLRRAAVNKAYDKKQVLDLVNVLQPALETGDVLARRIVLNAAREYSDDVVCMARKAGGPPLVVVLGGGVLMHGPDLLVSTIKASVSSRLPGVEIIRPLCRPCTGAAVMAAYKSGMTTRDVVSMLEEASRTWR